MQHRFDLVEPLIHMGLDLSFEDDAHQPAYQYSPNLGNRSFTVEVHQLLVSNGIYDEADWSDDWVRHRMIESAEVFDWFLANVFVDFYHWPLEKRMELLGDPFEGKFDHRVISRIFRPHGGFRAEDLLHPTGFRKLRLFEWANVAYFASIQDHWIARSQPSIYLDPDLGRRVEHMRPAIRELVAIMDQRDLSARAALFGCQRGTYLFKMVLLLLDIGEHWCTTGVVPSLTPRLQQRDIQCLVRGWVEEVHAGGKDLDRLAEVENSMFAYKHSCGHWRQGMTLFDTDWARFRSGYRWHGLTTGSRPEDWSLVWEWDPDVEGFVGDFWASIEAPPQTPMPGSWVVANEGDGSGEAILLHCGLKH
jgi:hypothetical protein